MYGGTLSWLLLGRVLERHAFSPYRIAHTSWSAGVDPFNILSLDVYEQSSPRDERAELRMLLGGTEAKNLWMGTFHSVFARILQN